MGVDLPGEAVSSDDDEQDTARADTILLYVVDSENKTFSVLNVNRDTMAVVDILNLYGDPVAQTTQQISFAYCYSQVASANCENVARAVSRLLGGIEVNGYVSVQFDAIPLVNDALGGVRVKIEDDFSADDPSLVQGETVELKGSQATSFLRHRLSVGDGTNASRMRRQAAYLNAFTARLREELSAGNSAIVNELYSAASPYMISNMSLSDISNLAVRCAGYAQGGTKTLSGTSQDVTYKTGETNTEYTVDRGSLDSTVLELFYEKQ
jgi:LCP family protein required for cell wall assembly